jgi:translation initiation factor 1A
MPGSNTTGGKHHKKGKKKKGQFDSNNDNKIEFAGTNQVYSIVKKKPGGSRIALECSDGKERSGIIPGKFFKKIWMNVGDVLLCELDIGNDSQCYITHKYSVKDASILKSQGKITFDITEEKQDGVSFKFNDNNQKNGINRMLPDINNGDSSDSSSNEELMKKNPNRNNMLTKENEENEESEEETGSDTSNEIDLKAL